MNSETTSNGVAIYTPAAGSATAQVTIDEIIEAVLKYQPHANVELIRRAYELANAAHAGQKRASGEEYIIHPLNVAKILTELMIDATTISAALLHDVVEDTTYTEEQMAEIFGKEVAMLIDGVTKLGKIKFQSKIEQQSENYRKLFLAMAKDIRVIIIKLADRLHNMRTLKFVSEEKQKRIALETIEVYAPLANRLGISNIKWELEDLCLRYLEPEQYYELVEKVNLKRQERQKFIEDAILQIHTKLIRSSVKAEISGRAKHFYSIWRKMRRDKKDISEIYDLSAVRVLVHNVRDCYAVLGVIHAMWKPIPGRFKDYIAMPKSNGYQSLHTTVMARGYPLEIQIRTFSMHKVSEYGVAAHWKYKESGKGSMAETDYDKKLSWLRQILNLQQDLKDSGEYVEALKMDIFSDEVFVFTPRGDVISLPKGAVPIDFAYHIHTDVGHHCVGAKVNGKIVPLEYKLKNGDLVSIITNKNNDGPSRDWLNIVAAADTRAKIRGWFKKARREENILRGHELLAQEAKKLGYDPKELIRDEWLNSVCLRFNLQSDEDLLASIGYGGVTVHGVIAKLIEHHKKAIKEQTPPDVSEMLEKIKTSQNAIKKSKSSHGILVEGEGGMMVRLARCCNPIPGDPITGFITKGRGVSVHRADCPNVLVTDGDYTRVIDVSWDIGLDTSYTVEIEITCNDTTGLLTQIMAVPAEMRINIATVNAKKNRSNRTSTVTLGLEIKNATQVSRVMANIRRLKDVYSVSRSMSSNGGNNS
ncbi:MAG: bifunctional (p)ppGpp synthetase/guanosine-3',5'-bis(diphosphate) 3'-pyrophosphohydrolase [Selenomonadales bacterium]|nr:bifunctional (p)ppGpp synthetase/guanosine-3',5'-bis(diphosphate) 3'-pyrophosphohydrolase [Selenomonadales bacterium]MDD6218872.1 bifunctional (p)ppGpp synthetase/guanosine-3',5'-bis(diphosphate) 3'-pyrophosphohydrolase [Selenomonadaceae bacterium]